jgi:hypothetical protein
MRRAKVSLPPVCVAVREQYTHADCALRAVAMATGLPYEDVARHAHAKALAEGLHIQALHALGHKLGVNLTLTPDADLDDQDTTGLCWVEFPRSAHLTYIFKGVLCDPAQATVWTPSEYLAAYDGTGVLYRVTAPARVRQRGKEQ